MEKLRLIASQIIRREKLKLRICNAEQDVFEKNTEPIQEFLKQSPLPKGRPPENKNRKILKLMKRSISKENFSPNITKIDKEKNFVKKRKYIKKTGVVIKKSSSKYFAKKMLMIKLKEKNKIRRNKLLKMIRKTTKKIIPNLLSKKNQENPNEARDHFYEKHKKPGKVLKCELKGLVRTQNTKELSFFMEASKRSAINKKILRSRNMKRKLRSNKMYRFNN